MISDLNDNSPVFTRKLYTKTVSEVNTLNLCCLHTEWKHESNTFVPIVNVWSVVALEHFDVPDLWSDEITGVS